MIIKRIAVTATLVTALATGAVGATAASASTTHVKPAATPACSSNCIDISNLALGTGTLVNAYVPGNHGTGEKAGQVINLHEASNLQVNEDFTPSADGRVWEFCDAYPAPQSFSPTSYACLNYRGFSVYEADFSPFGNQSGLCAGVAAAVAGEHVSLQKCGQTDATLWIADATNGTGGDCRVAADYCPWVNGASSSFSHGLVLTLNTGTRKPVNQLFVEPENLLTSSVAADSQQFTLTPGPTP